MAVEVSTCFKMGISVCGTTLSGDFIGHAAGSDLGFLLSLVKLFVLLNRL